ncbi:MAG: AMP-binding protein [Syntrophobacteraceae bacterium]
MKKIYNVACELLDPHLQTRGDKVAIYFDRQTITYSRLREQTNRFGNILKGLGLQPGERVLIALPDCPECIYAFLGSMKSMGHGRCW